MTIEGRDFWLGPWKSKASLVEHDRLIAEWIANGRKLPTGDSVQGRLAVVELIAAYLKHARVYYRKNGKPTSEVEAIKSCVRRLKALFGRLPAAEFSPLKLKAVRQKMIDAGWCRKQINNHQKRIIRAGGYGVRS